MIETLHNEPQLRRRMTFSVLVTQMPVLLSCVGFIVLAQPHTANGELTNSRFISALMGLAPKLINVSA